MTLYCDKGHIKTQLNLKQNKSELQKMVGRSKATENSFGEIHFFN